MSIYDKIFPPKLLTLPNGKQVSKPRSRAPLAAVILVAMTILSVEVTGFDMGILVSRIKEFFVILGEMIPPEWDYMPQIWQPLFDTIKMSLLGSFIGSILVVPFAMLASTNIIHSRVVVAAMRLLLSIIRTLPTLVSALIATYIFGLGTLAGTTAIAIFTFAYIGKAGACQTAIGGISSFRYRGCNVQWISECELLYTQLQENVWGITS